MTVEPQTFRSFSTLFTLVARPASGLCGSALPPMPGIQRSCRTAPTLAWGVSPGLRKQGSAPLSSQGPTFAGSP